MVDEFQSTRPARGATISRSLSAALDRRISIHAPREGRDSCVITPFTIKSNFNPRAPRGARPMLGKGLNKIIIDFNPRAPRGARQNSSHSKPNTSTFQSTRPARGATVYLLNNLGSYLISIHAPREGRDKLRKVSVHHLVISIHAPREGRDESSHPTICPRGFQSTRPARGATSPPCKTYPLAEISIHAPREGRDHKA